MEKARKKIRFCMFFVIFTAVIVGFLYYYGQIQSETDISEGTLISNVGLELYRLCQ